MNASEIVDRYNYLTGSRFNRDNKHITTNIDKCLKEYGAEDCITVMEWVLNNDWYKENGFDTLSVIFRPTKFQDKLERAIRDNSKKTDNKYKVSGGSEFYEGLEIL